MCVQDSTQRVQLSLLFDDLGNFGCVGDCTSRESYSYVAQHQMAIMIYDKKYKPAYKLRGAFPTNYDSPSRMSKERWKSSGQNIIENVNLDVKSNCSLKLCVGH